MSAARDYGLDDDYEWARPPEGGWTADDLDELPNLYELDPATQTYGLIGIFHDKLQLTVPFPAEIDLTAINRRR
ncbi:hypothetical protein ABZY09_18495 [Streptomyces sp. NPDC002928]|uniref:hypothetical protein n=1 Tax=Streptomyces sp. NPDC002928 TaxID=3154440 RepID=UPI0033A2F9C9